MSQPPTDPAKLNYQAPQPKSRRKPLFLLLAVTLFFGGILVALSLLPTLARRGIDRVGCESNMKQIGMAILLYCNENKGHYPPRLDLLLTTQDIAPEIFTCPSSDDLRATGPTTQAIATQLSAGNHLSYLYLGADLTSNCDPNTVVLLEPLSNHANTGSNALFADGHVEFLSVADARQLLDRYANGEHPLIYNPNPHK